MTDKTDPKAGPWRSVVIMTKRIFDVFAFQNIRLADIENRLALLDGGPGATASRKTAYHRLSNEYEGEGRGPPDFKI